MSTEFGQAQINARERRGAEFCELKTNEESFTLSKAPVFSCGVGVLPEIPNFGKIFEAVHLNSGKLICKFLARISLYDTDKEKRQALPWDALVLVSNESLLCTIRIAITK